MTFNETPNTTTNPPINPDTRSTRTMDFIQGQWLKIRPQSKNDESATKKVTALCVPPNTLRRLNQKTVHGYLLVLGLVNKKTGGRKPHHKTYEPRKKITPSQKITPDLPVHPSSPNSSVLRAAAIIDLLTEISRLSHKDRLFVKMWLEREEK